MKKQPMIVHVCRHILIPIVGLSFAYATFGQTQQQTPNPLQWSDSVVETEEEGTSVMIIPMDGQMHTDIRHDVYDDLVDRIKEINPDLIIVEMLSMDWKNNFQDQKSVV